MQPVEARQDVLERRERDIVEGREPRQIPALPAEWEGWDDDLFDLAMARQFGWTVDEIDRVDRNRVRQWFVVEEVYGLARQHLKKGGDIRETLTTLERGRR